MRQPTQLDLSVLALIVGFFNKAGTLPTTRQLAELTGRTSSNVRYKLKVLKEAGYVEGRLVPTVAGLKRISAMQK